MCRSSPKEGQAGELCEEAAEKSLLKLSRPMVTAMMRVSIAEWRREVARCKNMARDRKPGWSAWSWVKRKGFVVSEVLKMARK